MTPLAAAERLYLLDGMALAYRAYYSFIARPLRTSTGMNTSAVYGFVTALMKILDEDRPEHIAAVFDTPEPTFRHLRYPAYKATRERMPEEMAAQLDRLKEAVRCFTVPLIEAPGYEADDVMGTLARRAEREGVATFLVTGDKDFMQLISPLIRIYRPGKAGGDPDIVDETGVREKFGVTPERVIEVLGLTGDSSDNIPGVPGIGEKTAVPLIQAYGTIDALYERLEEIPQKGVREKLRTHRELAFLSRELATIRTDVPLPIDFHELRAARRDSAALLRLFTELEFRGLATRIRESSPRNAPAEPATSAPPEAARTTDVTTDEHRYVIVGSTTELDAVCAGIAAARSVAIDTETTSTDPLRAALVGISLSWKEREAWYIPLAGQGAVLALRDVADRLGPLLADPAIAKVGQNIKYDMLVLRSHGMPVEGVAFDTMVASYVLRADGQHNLDALALEECGHRMVSWSDLVGGGKQKREITDVPLARLAEYSAEDADFTFRIHRLQQEKLRAQELLGLCTELEFPLIPVLERMEAAGIALDVAHLEAMSKELGRMLSALETSIHRDAGGVFNINSTKQLGTVLFSTLGLPAVRKTKTGLSTDVGVLESLRGQHPIIDRLLEYRQLTKLKSTYVDALPQLRHPVSGRIHTSYNQTVAATGRLSSSDPNLQNIPIRTELGSAIRRAFIPGGPGLLLLSADYSQIELRVMAHMSGDEGLTEAFRNGEDIHRTTAEKVFGVGHGEASRDMRRKAKEVNFGIMYGIGPFGLAGRLETTQAEAKEIIRLYFERFPKVKQYIHDTIETARRTGYVTTMLGRRRYLPDISSRNGPVRANAERQAINMPIQGSAADMIKRAMIAVDARLRKESFRSRMLLQVHDELVFETPEGEAERLGRLAAGEMKNALPLSVPVEVDVGVGKHWLEAH